MNKDHYSMSSSFIFMLSPFCGFIGGVIIADFVCETLKQNINIKRHEYEKLNKISSTSTFAGLIGGITIGSIICMINKKIKPAITMSLITAPLVTHFVYTDVYPVINYLRESKQMYDKK